MIHILTQAYSKSNINKRKYYCITTITKKDYATMNRHKLKVRKREAEYLTYPLKYEILINPDLDVLKVPAPVMTEKSFTAGLCSFHYRIDGYPEYQDNQFNTIKGREVKITKDSIKFMHTESDQNTIMYIPDIDFAFLNVIFNS